MKATIAGVLILLAASMTSKSQVKIGFEVSFTEPQAHYAEVQMDLSGLDKDYIDLKMPVWTPGSYLVREFARNIEGFTASSDGKALRFEKVRKNTWRIYNHKAGQVRVSYRVYAFEISVRTAFIDESHAFLSSSGIFLYPDGMLHLPSTVQIRPYSSWKSVSTGLEPVPGKAFTYAAANFDILFDSPIEVGNQDIFEFTASGVKHEVAMYGGGNYDKEKLKKDMARIVEQATAIYGENPNKHYTFIVHNFQQGGGGLEHLNSTVLGSTRDGYSDEKKYKEFLALVAHEYYHLWNVKRLRPMALGPFDYDNENYTTNLWVAEGFTSYYENKLLLSSGFQNAQQTVQNLADAISVVMNTPGSRVQSAAEASYDAWIKAYRPNENSSNSTISYYNKGEIIGMLMDIEIARATKGKRNLDDVMKAMYDEYYKKQQRGYTDAEFKAMAEKISGISFSPFWDRYVNGTGEIEYEKYFSYAGVAVKDLYKGNDTPYLGAASKRVEGSVVITKIIRGTAAWDGGLNVNDEVLSVEGLPVEAAIDRMYAITSRKPGDLITIVVRRDGLIKTVGLRLKANPNVKIEATIDPAASPEQVTVRKRWLGQ